MKRWKLNLYTLWVTQIISLTSFGLGLPFMPFYIQKMGVTDPDKIKLFTGILSTAPAITMAIMSPIWGKLSDRFGRKLMILRAMVAAVIVIGAMGFATNVWQLVILRGIQGLFTGTVTAATAFVAADTPKNRLSYALGFMSSSNFIGYALGPVLGGIFAERFGYRFSFFAGSVLMFIGVLLTLFLLVEDKSTIGIKKEEFSHSDNTVKLFTPMILSLLLVLFLHRITRTVFSPYIPLFVQESLNSTKGASKLTGIINGTAGVATALSGLTISRLGDRLNKLRLATVLIIISFSISLTLRLASSLYVFIALYGIMFFFLGGIEPIVTSTTAENTPSERRGELFGFQGLVGSLGWMVSPMIGAYISLNYSIRSILSLLPVLTLGIAIVLFKLNRTRTRCNRKAV
ncbi:MFS transporter [Maledivibacter halophilus]|uniref:MFS transporter, DHA1 family, multidrug resistance protein n=1 Tax=Maledivibacter halophilus TaxID=36842 RepID=A0A1T5J448_9FIRM|nr:MFS transporter [Maledivibacter halophilus]SKC46215.1 MFS transporter, DHA1 family, multidrug resistance protein [Maledivibacter halophilus]